MNQFKKRGPKPGIPVVSTEQCSYGCKQIARYQTVSGRLCCSLSPNSCVANKAKASVGLSKAHKLGRMPDNSYYWDKAGEIGRVNQAKNRQEIYDTYDWKNFSGAQRRKKVLEEQDGKCLHCGIFEWLNQNLVLEIDHIDGNHYNNVRENLRALCPNCHSLTPTHRNKKRIQTPVVER